MLVLTRERDQAIYIGDGIKVTVVEVKGDKVKLGIEAPKEVSVHRREVYYEIQKENYERFKGLLRLENYHAAKYILSNLPKDMPTPQELEMFNKLERKLNEEGKLK